MKIFKVERLDDADIGEYYEFVCITCSMDDAARLDPETGMWMFVDDEDKFVCRAGKPMKWTDSLKNVKVTFIGNVQEDSEMSKFKHPIILAASKVDE